ncbi:hypothetical protein EC957_003271 [Mortierella hygrophila]|uniref:C-type lectin domain-containing protein n=1 Tax=Mortierella hygrophila TaxID=979708 RepID=A0A9P6K100_9FUNG|nr:hypothetical protein EC957_003271 [Mortierella hygrophila]
MSVARRGNSPPLVQPCDAIPRDSDKNQRVDAPSPDDYPPLEGPNFAFTSQTPLGNLSEPREYADGAQATQKLIADPIVPINRQLWTGIDTRTAYFKNDFGQDKISRVPELLQAGMRRLVLDLWWDSAALGWQLCPRLKRDTTGSPLTTLRLALEQEQERIRAMSGSAGGVGGGATDDSLLQLQGMGNIAPAVEATAEEFDQESGLGQEQEQEQGRQDNVAEGVPPLSQPFASSLSPSAPISPPLSVIGFSSSTSSGERSTEEDPDSHPTMNKRASPPKNNSKNSPTNSNTKSNHNSRIKNTHNNKKVASVTGVKGAESKGKSRGSRGREWFRKKKRPVRPPIKPKAFGIDHHHKEPMATETTGSSVRGVSRYAASHHPHKGAPNRLAMSKGIVASYNALAAGAADQTMDGITCSTGEDIVLLLQALEAWIERSRSPELEDVILIILNLNELNNNSLGTRPSTPLTTPPTPTSATPAPPGATPTMTPPISNAEFFEHINSPNTNRTINELAATKMVSLRQLFIDAFPQSIYTPNLLELDRADVEATWWKGGPVGLDYYNTTWNPTTNKLEAPTGWPTSLYLRKEAKRRIVIGIGSNNLAANTTYNITDDYQTFHRQEAMSPSMTNSSLLRVSSTLNQDTCSLPVPGVLMNPTGSEESFAEIAALRRRGETITDDVTWSFTSMSDNDMSPWTFLSGRVVTNCGFSSLVEGRSQSLTYSEQTAMTIWSWDLDQPPDEIMRDRSRRCGAMNSNGRWVVQDCNDKLPVACRKIGTSSQWIINEKGAGNYRDVTCPEGYKFDVPRTARENQILYSTIQAFRNTTAYSFLPSSQSPALGQLEKSASSLKPAFNRFTDAVSDVFKNLKKREERTGKLEPHHDKNNSHDDGENDDARSNNGRKAQSVSDEHQQQQQHSGGSTATRIKEVKAEPTAMAGANEQSGGGVIWIDISSWQTAGCWVPGGSDGICPYQEPDNTVALQDIIKVSTIGGVTILVLVGVFLYMKFRRNGRLRKAGRRRADVRRKILLTEVETVPA